MNGYLEELIGKVEELLHATDDPDNYRMHIQYIIQFSSDGLQRLKREGVCRLSSSASGCASTLVDLQTEHGGYTGGLIVVQLLTEYLTKL